MLVANGIPFRELDSDEEKEFREWARKNYKTGDNIDIAWHPVVQDECHNMNVEFLQNIK